MDERIELRPANRRLKTIPVGPEDDMRIIGKVLHVCSHASVSPDSPEDKNHP